MEVPIGIIALSALLFCIALIQATVAWHMRRRGATGRWWGWRVEAVFALGWVNLGLTLLFYDVPLVRLIGLAVLLVLLPGAWYGDWRANQQR